MTQTDVSYETFQLERQGDVMVVTIDNPPMNVINLTLARELHRILDDIGVDRSIRSVLFRSATPGVFVAGADISLIKDLDESNFEQLKELGDVFDKLAALPQPTVAALSGSALGGGFEFALACDFRIMAEGYGEVGCPEVRLGLLPGGGGTQRLPRMVGQAVATEMLVKGMRYTPDTALALGLVNKVVPADELDAQAMKFAQGLAAQAPLAVQHVKRLIRMSFEQPGQQSLQLERELFHELVHTEDAQEGISAFFEGRKPEFKGK